MIFDKRYFEKVFASPGSWGHSLCRYEEVKYTRQIEAIKRYSPRPQNILEVGCARGIHTAMMAEAFPGARIMCVDISHLAIDAARWNCRPFDNVELIEANIVELLRQGRSFRNAFDIAVQSESLYYLFPGLVLHGNLAGYLHAIARTLRGGGIFVTSNGLNIVTRPVMGACYRILKRLGVPLLSAEYREWNEFRNKYVTYDLRVFRMPGQGPQATAGGFLVRT